MITAAIVARLSREERETGSSIENQLGRCEGLAEDMDFHVPPEYIFIKDGVSGELVLSCPVLQQLLALARAGKIQAAIAKDQDRWHRNEYEFETWLRQMSQARCLVFAGRKLLNPDEESYEDWKERKETGLDAEKHRRKTKKLVREALEQRAQRGKIQGARAMGWRWDSELKILVVDPDTAPYVKEMYQRFVFERESLHSLARWFREELGIRGARGGTIRPSTIQSMLRAPRNAGLTKHRGKILLDRDGRPVPYAGGSIITPELYHQAMARFSPAGRPAEGYVHVLKGIVCCSHWTVTANSHFAGEPMPYYHHARSKTGQPTYRHYGQMDALTAGGTPADALADSMPRSISAKALDALVISQILNSQLGAIFERDVRSAAAQARESWCLARKSAEDQVKELQRLEKDAESMLDKAIRLELAAAKDYELRLQHVRAQLEAARVKVTQIPSEPAQPEAALEIQSKGVNLLREAWQAQDLTSCRLLLAGERTRRGEWKHRGILERVDVRVDGIKLVFRPIQVGDEKYTIHRSS